MPILAREFSGRKNDMLLSATGESGRSPTKGESPIMEQSAWRSPDSIKLPELVTP